MLITKSDTHFFTDANVAYQLLQMGYQALEVGSHSRIAGLDHLPGSYYLNTNEIESEENGWNILSAEFCMRVLSDKGITSSTSLLIYSSSLSAACRIAFIAYWLGLTDIKILEDGLASWQKLNYPLESDWTSCEKASSFGLHDPKRSEILISTSEDLLKAQKDNPELVLASVRSLTEYQGTTSCYAYIEQAGEPAGAVWAKASCGKNDVADLLTLEKKIKPLVDIAKAWKANGITREKEVVFYCGTGWRASVAFFIAKELGWQKVRLFDGGWYDWSQKHVENPKKFPLKNDSLGHP
ncbi:sulfurtransferase [Enterococcus sp. AZ072]|uniref:sulfurtransferase n=2 Tax=Enterococcus TaxID=1350 RepID=UPI003D29F728